MSNLFSQPSYANSVSQLVNKTAKEQFLRFYLHPDTKMMLPIKQITEVLKIQPGQIVPIPQMPAWVMGVYNWRGDILWMLDLGYLIGLDSWYQQDLNRSSYSVIVLSPHKGKSDGDVEANIHLGLVVTQVEDIETCDPATIQSAVSNQAGQIQSFLPKCWLKPGGEIISVLDDMAVIAAMPQQMAV